MCDVCLLFGTKILLASWILAMSSTRACMQDRDKEFLKDETVQRHVGYYTALFKPVSPGMSSVCHTYRGKNRTLLKIGPGLHVESLPSAPADQFHATHVELEEARSIQNDPRHQQR
jgi:hypothetical protein